MRMDILPSFNRTITLGVSGFTDPPRGEDIGEEETVDS
jgi:hypothetical protein